VRGDRPRALGVTATRQVFRRGAPEGRSPYGERGGSRAKVLGPKARSPVAPTNLCEAKMSPERPAKGVAAARDGVKMWYVYLLRCADGSLYSGSTTDLTKRLKRHLSGRGGKYTRAKKAVALEYAENFNARRDALKREIEIKKLSRFNKEKLVRFGNGKRYVPIGTEKN